jgi:hypothetical protein
MSQKMSSDNFEDKQARIDAQRENPPSEWVKLRKKDTDSFSNGDFAKTFCEFIDRFYWRSREDEPDELHVVMFKEDEENPRYRYLNVSKEVYDEMWERAYFPEDYGRPFGVWFGQNIRGEYEYENYS